MLIQFTVGNYKSFKDDVVLSMLAANLTSQDKALDQQNLFAVTPSLHLLKSAAVYGANASGKSNLVAALRFMQRFVISSSKDSQADEPIAVQSFRLSTTTEQQPSSFEVVFVMEQLTYRYGFQVTESEIIAEWLYYVPTIREARLFQREGQDIRVAATFKEGQTLRDKTRPNALFLSVVAQFNGKLAIKILEWFKKLTIISGLNDTILNRFTTKRIEDTSFREEIAQFVNKMDVGIDNIQIKKENVLSKLNTRGTPNKFTITKKGANEFPNTQPEDMEISTVMTLHKKFDAEQQHVDDVLFELEQEESAGTQKLFALSGVLLQTLKEGRIIVIDEYDARLHPLITKSIVQLFNSNETNRNNAQMLFTTHDTNLLRKELFRRDQIWFMEKDQYGASHLYSLAEYKVRNDASYESDYIRGKYGAIPFIGNLSQLLDTQYG